MISCTVPEKYKLQIDDVGTKIKSKDTYANPYEVIW